MVDIFRKGVSILDVYTGKADDKETERDDRENRVKEKYNCIFFQW